MDTTLVLIANFPDRPSAEAFARAVLDERLAACVNLLAPCTSMYRWNGQVETAEEIPVLIKTRESLYGAVERALCRLHPYQVPELLALPVAAGLPAYLEWIAAETGEARA